MLRRSKRLIAAAAIAAGLVTVLPASPAMAMAPCQVRSFSTLQGGQTNVIVGAYTASGATDVSLVCGLVRNGVTVSRYGDKIPGPVAALATTSSVGGYFTVCHELRVTYLDRPPTVSDWCP